MTTDSVTVITLTRARPELALRAITSVRGQDYDDDVTHVVIIDECEESADVLGALESSPGRGLSIVQRKRLASEHGPASASRGSVYGRMGRLINVAVAESCSRWIALLDDDNEFTPDHLRSLRDAATAAAVPAAHSHRTIHWADGSAYLLERFPWIADDHLAVVAYHSLCRRGVWERGTNVLKDRAGPLISGRFLNSTIAGPLDPVMMVDHSTWFRRLPARGAPSKRGADRLQSPSVGALLPRRDLEPVAKRRRRGATDTSVRFDGLHQDLGAIGCAVQALGLLHPVDDPVGRLVDAKVSHIDLG